MADIIISLIGVPVPENKDLLHKRAARGLGLYKTGTRRHPVRRAGKGLRSGTGKRCYPFAVEQTDIDREFFPAVYGDLQQRPPLTD